MGVILLSSRERGKGYILGFMSRAACDRISISVRIGRHVGPCTSNRLEQIMESVGLAQICAGLEGWQAEPGFWVVLVYGY